MSLTVAPASDTPRSSRKTPLYELVLDHHERFAQVYDEKYAPRYGPWRPHVEDTLLRYLDCGDFSMGFLRVACTPPGCRHEILVPFSCKRAVCPSCAQRRSLDSGEFVNAEVLEGCLHAIVSCGAWTSSGPSFCKWPVHLTGVQLEMLFRRKMLALLVERERVTLSTAERLMQWNPSGFWRVVGRAHRAGGREVTVAACPLCGKAPGGPRADGARSGDEPGQLS